MIVGEDWQGRAFGKWIVLQFIKKVIPGKRNKYVCLCQCTCEAKTIKEVPVYNLKNGESKSCGCLRKIPKGRICQDCGRASSYKNAWHKTDPATKEKVMLCNVCYLMRWQRLNKVKTTVINNRWHKKHPEVKKRAIRVWTANNPEKVRGYKRKHRHTSLKYRLSQALRQRLREVLKGNNKSAHTLELLGCSVEFFKSHLERQFTEGMTWDTYGKGKDKWNIDHITPLASFDLTDEAQLRKAFNYLNTQPMWEPDNMRKHDKILPNKKESL